MPQQTGRNLLVAYKPETTFNTPPSAGSGFQFRPNASPGLTLARQLIRSNEIRSDLKDTMARLGSKEVKGSYAADLSVGTFDTLIEAAMRGTWSSVLTATQADFTSVTQGANSIVGASGSFITKGFRVGDVIQANITGGPAGNNNRNLRITAITASTITTAETLTVDAVARTTFTITRTKKVINPAVPVRRSFTFEEYDADIDLSEQATGVRVSGMKISGQPNGMCLIEFMLVGADLNPLNSAASPFYTTPTLTTSIGLVLADATIRYAGADIATLTAFDCTLDNRAATLPVIGSLVTPDVFDNNAQSSGSISCTRADLQNLTRFTSETELELQILAVEPTAEPKNFVSLYIPRLKLTSLNKGIGQDNALIETLPFIVGDKGTVSGYDATMLAVQTSAT